ncbi:GrpB family protein [Fibrella sp. WM1]|uniref:GrpB family protein n=1 Tax=Fibrella musci TaxID=3242485 RepID=UPI003521F086
MTKSPIHVTDYSPIWAATFEQLAAIYQAHLGDAIIGIHHVGSTAVPGLAAKAVIDIDLEIANRGDLKPVIDRLTKLGYVYRGNQGITDRAAFKRLSDQTPIDGSERTWPSHHLYVCPSDSISLRNHLALRDWLRQHPDGANVYGTLKKKLAQKHPYDMNAYIEGKTPFITAILKAAGFDDIALQTIIQENRATPNS